MRRFLKRSPFGKGDAPKEQGDIYKKQFLAYNPNLTAKARELRKNMTEAEKKLRYKFLQPLDVKVLRQQPIDEYIVDFYVASKKLIIEIDGDTHWTDNEIKYDEQRTKILNNL
jgi:very-short-patch-repair endonuclease